MKKKLLAISFLLLSVAVGALNDVFSRYALQTLSFYVKEERVF